MDIRDIVLRTKDLSMTDVLGILSHVCTLTREELLTDMTRSIEESRLKEVEKLIGERKMGKPLAYITGKKEFYSQDFYVNKNVLVPRPETEILVEEALRIIETSGNIDGIIDMGTGSGAIGLTIAKRTSQKVLCIDISPKALEVARRNAVTMNVLQRTHFISSNLFDAVRKGTHFGMILANLPYVSSDEWSTLMDDVRNFEPKDALWGGKDGIEIYHRFFTDVRHYLRNGGYLLCETGGTRQACLLDNILQSMGFKTITRKDYTGEERVIIGTWTNLS